jgi:hypothetical protein
VLIETFRLDLFELGACQMSSLETVCRPPCDWPRRLFGQAN